MRSGASRAVEIGVAWPRRGDVRAAFGPLVEDGTVSVLQLTVEHAFRGPLEPEFTGPLDAAAAAGTLVGHAVFGSPFTHPRDRMTVDWLARARQVLARWPVRWLTDHVGCCRFDGWNAAPVPLPASPALVDAAVAHLDWVREAVGVPVGLENLALSASVEDVLVQPELVGSILERVDGVLLLDLHNLWCQAVNFGLDPVALMRRWPLERVRQIHVSGGSWMEHAQGRLRRDTHDGAVPDAVFALIPEAVERCPALECVVLERLRGTVPSIPDLQEEVRSLGQWVDRPASSSPADLSGRAVWRTEPPSIAGPLFRALRQDDRDAIEALAPGWWTDARTWDVARHLMEKWGYSVPT